MARGFDRARNGVATGVQPRRRERLPLEVLPEAADDEARGRGSFWKVVGSEG